MNLYLDDDLADGLLVRLLKRAGHDVKIPADAGLTGSDDAIHLTYAIEQNRVCLTANHEDFLNLHVLIMRAQGHHPGILVVRKDNDPKRDLTQRGIVQAIRNLEAAATDLPDSFHMLNQWR